MLFFRVIKRFQLNLTSNGKIMQFIVDSVYPVHILNSVSFGGFIFDKKSKFLEDGKWIVEETNLKDINTWVNSLLLLSGKIDNV